jgi:hypothetical protein
LGFDRDQTLGLRSIIPLRTALRCLGQGEKQCFFATHLEYRAFYFRASCTALLRLFEVISRDGRTQPFLLLIILDFCRKPAGFRENPSGPDQVEIPPGKDSG